MKNSWTPWQSALGDITNGRPARCMDSEPGVNDSSPPASHLLIFFYFWFPFSNCGKSKFQQAGWKQRAKRAQLSSNDKGLKMVSHVTFNIRPLRFGWVVFSFWGFFESLPASSAVISRQPDLNLLAHFSPSAILPSAEVILYGVLPRDQDERRRIISLSNGR